MNFIPILLQFLQKRHNFHRLHLIMDHLHYFSTGSCGENYRQHEQSHLGETSKPQRDRLSPRWTHFTQGSLWRLLVEMPGVDTIYLYTQTTPYRDAESKGCGTGRKEPPYENQKDLKILSFEDG